MKDKVYILNIKNMHIEYKTLLNELPMYCLHKIDNGCNEKLKKERTIAWYMLYKLLLVYHNIDLTKCNIYENKNGTYGCRFLLCRGDYRPIASFITPKEL